ncbi:aspartyl-tRNA synthetase [Lojkania enalia]|uniref:Aspartyl-tRNA synthetase n=1 Tax=Lojkania enalia TaxID=147567 RepID=A0A9P4TS25_9PLEO|nr:aspartyl-tRNA synthetase [Didymosphaeria enalia]
MVLRAASWRVVCPKTCVRRSYAEISRFIRARGHGILPRTTPTLGIQNNPFRFFTSTSICARIEPNEEQRGALNAYKSTVHGDNDPTLALYGVTDFASLSLEKCEPGTEISLSGYLDTRRDMSSGLSFVMLRDSSQGSCIQLVSSFGGVDRETADMHLFLKSLKEWTPVTVEGVIKKRLAPRNHTYSGMNLIKDREIQVTSIKPLNELVNDIVLKEETVFPPELRHLQLRTNREARQNLLFRQSVMKEARNMMVDAKFVEIETPILFKSTPEGAREFLVPTRTRGQAYALPQSPQQYKQILMASGIDKYYQFARCFRDEDLRADRQPEFTQLDIEMAFAGEHEVMTQVNSLLYHIGKNCLDNPWLDNENIPRMTYWEAMALYGSDKPDLRFDAKIHSVTNLLPQDLINKITPLDDPAIDAFTMEVSDDSKVTRKFISDFLDSPEGKHFLDNADGQPGVFILDVLQPLHGLGALGHEFAMNVPETITLEPGCLLVLQARKNEPFHGGSTQLGNLRLALHKAAAAQGLIKPLKGFEFVWVTDFPLFSPSNDTDPGQGGSAGLSATHHPFTAPKTQKDVELLLTAPEKAIAAHYDIVVNGVELGGGSRRIHNADVQEIIFRDVLKMKPERIEDFRHLLNVLRSGCPPHAGIALGWDRLIAVMLGKDSLDTYHLRLT